MKFTSILITAIMASVAAADHYPWSQCGGGNKYGGSKACPSDYVCRRLNSHYKQCVKSGYLAIPEYSTLNPYAPPTATEYADISAGNRPTSYPRPSSYPEDWKWPGKGDYPAPSDYPMPSGYSSLPSEFTNHQAPRSTPEPALLDYQTPADYPAPAEELADSPNEILSEDPTPTNVPISENRIRPRAGAFTPVIGAPGIETRYPIDQLQSQFPDVFNMFIIALEAMQKLSESGDISYYQIAGIHGVPNIPWQYPVPSGGNPSYGYCTHDSVLFCNWHRPYLVLIEQELVKQAVSIAASFKGTAATTYQAAAKKVRLPYWDWAATSSNIPNIVASATIQVKKPGTGGTAVTSTINNPLYSYTFTNNQYRAQYFDGYVQEPWKQTVRCPTRASQPASQNSVASRNLQADFASRKESVFQLFSIENFGRFSTDRFPGPSTPQDWASVEGLHNTIHGTIGGNNGHMTYIGVSSFDPIFWLHHCQVDRLAAIYQAIHPGNTIQPLSRSQPNFGYPNNGGVEDASTKLYPFRHASGVEWTSNDVASASSIWTNGYAYPEVPASYQSQPAASLKTFASTAMQNLYGPKLKPASNNQLFASAERVAAGNGDIVRTEWLAHISLDGSQIPGTFEVRMYLSDKTVGAVTSFGGAAKKSSIPISGTVPLTQALLDNGASDALATLRDFLTWKIMKDGNEIPLSQLPSLQVGVSGAQVTYYSDKSKLPTYGEWTTYYEVTNGKVGGLEPEKSFLVVGKVSGIVARNADTKKGKRGVDF